MCEGVRGEGRSSVDGAAGMDAVDVSLLNFASSNSVTFVEFSAETYTVSEGDNFVALVINKTGVTQDDIPVIVQLEDGTAKGNITRSA